MLITADAQEVGEDVVLTVTADTTIVAAAHTSYRQSQFFEEPLNGRILYVSLKTAARNIYAWDEPQIKTSPVPFEPMVIQWEGPEQTMSRGDRLFARVKFTVKRSRHDFYVIFFGTSVIEPRVIVSASAGLQITSSGSDRQPEHGEDEWVQVNGNEYTYHKVFLTADHIQIRWKPKAGA